MEKIGIEKGKDIFIPEEQIKKMDFFETALYVEKLNQIEKMINDSKKENGK